MTIASSDSGGGERNGGFTWGTPWIKVNSNYPEINVKKQSENKDSILNYYRDLINIRNERVNLLVYGDYCDLMPDDEHIFAYLRSFKDNRILVILNFSSEETILENGLSILKDLGEVSKIKLLLANYSVKNKNIFTDDLKLNPYKARVYVFTNYTRR